MGSFLKNEPIFGTRSALLFGVAGTTAACFATRSGGFPSKFINLSQQFQNDGHAVDVDAELKAKS